MSKQGAIKVHTQPIPVYAGDTLELHGQRGVVLSQEANPYYLGFTFPADHPDAAWRNAPTALYVRLDKGGYDYCLLREDHVFMEGSAIDALRAELAS